MSQGRRLLELTVTFGLLVGFAGCTNHLAKSNQTVRTSNEDSSFTSPMASPHVLPVGGSASPVMGSAEPPPVVYGMGSAGSAASAQSLAPDPANLSTDDYRIGREDVLHVAIFQVPDLNRTVRVDGGGFVSLPLVNRVPLRGMTITQAQEEITRRYSRSYL
jgi:hypothetical protein